MKFENFTMQNWQNNALLPIAIIVLAGAIVVFINRNRIRHLWLEWNTRRCLNRLGIKQESNLRIPDGLGGSYKIDRLVLLHDSILLISLKPFSGNIYCAENIPEWTQVIGQKSFKFKNPLFDLEYQINAIHEHAPDVPVRAFLFFDHRASFPKGHPQQVLHPGNIPEYFFRANCPEPDSAVLEAWDVLLDIPKQAQPAK